MTKFCIHSQAGVSLVEASGVIKPCCKFQNTANSKTIFDIASLNSIHRSQEFVDIQTDLDNDVFPTGCNYCKQAESIGLQSRREYTNKMYNESDFFVPSYVQDLEIALDYTCNMMCRSCNPGASSRWNIATSVISQFDEHNIPIDTSNGYKSYQDQFRKVFNNTDLSHARIVKIQGGEPFYAKNLEWFIDKLDREVIDKTKLHIDIFTNGSIFPNIELLGKLSKLNASICFSLDAYGDLASAIRWGVDWSVIEHNIRKWRTFSTTNTNVRLLANVTVSLLNVNKLQPLLDFCSSLDINPDFSELTFPEYLSMFQLPKAIRSQWQYNNRVLNELIMLDMEIEPQLNKFLKSIDILDNYQGNSFKLENAEMYHLIQQLSPC